MSRRRTLALILAGGEGKRMDVLAQVRAKPSLSYAGVYRLIDLPLSNCMHSGMSDVWIVEQFQPHSINDHLANGRPWDLDRTYGGLQILPPHTGGSESGWHRGNADAIYRNKKIIRDFDPEIILVLSADHIYKFDYSAAIQAHRDRDATVTMVTTRVPLDKAFRFGTVTVDEQGKVTGFDYKPEKPTSDIVTTEIFVYDARTLLDTLDELAGQGDGAENEDEPALKDFGHELIPALVESGRAYAYPLEGYWQDVGTIESYWSSHMDLLAPEPPIDLDEPAWPILTYGVQRLPAHVFESARIANSLVAPGCHVRGQVEHSVLSPGVVIEEGAVVRHSILLHDTIVRAGAVVEYTIVDSAVEIGRDAVVGEAPEQAAGEKSEIADEQITLIGQGASIPDGARIAVGERVPPNDTTEHPVKQSEGAARAV